MNIILFSSIYILTWRKSEIKPYILFTPLYFIMTDLKNVSYWNMSHLKSIESTNHHTNGVYTNSSIQIEFSDINFSYNVTSKDIYPKLLDIMKTWSKTIDQSFKSNNFDFIEEWDIFSNYNQDIILNKLHRDASKKTPILHNAKIIFSSLILSAIWFIPSFYIHKYMENKNSRNFSTTVANVSNSPSPIPTSFPTPASSIPYSGSSFSSDSVPDIYVPATTPSPDANRQILKDKYESMKVDIKTKYAELDAEGQAIETQRQELDSLRGEIDASRNSLDRTDTSAVDSFNKTVEEYRSRQNHFNDRVNSYNNEIEEQKRAIKRFNEIVAELNATR